MRASTKTIGIITILLGRLMCNVGTGQQTDEASLGSTELKKLERYARQVCSKVTACVVAIKGKGKFGKSASGVIISADGLILSQYHVSHVKPGGDYEQSFKPGHKVTVIFHDDQRVEAKILGADRANDLSLLKLIEPGPYPYASVDQDAVVKVGDWVLKLGHPGGHRQGRPPVARLGRVLCKTDKEFISDCHVIGGDSGGPLFDLRGRLVGILYVCSSPPNIHIGPDSEIITRTGKTFSNLNTNTIQSRMHSMLRGEITPSIVRDAGRVFANADILHLDDWTQGTNVTSAFQKLVAKTQASVVTIHDGNARVAFGTIVDSEGWIVTKASVLSSNPISVMLGQTSTEAKLIGVHPAFDLALLRVAKSGLTAIDWADDPAPAVGTFVATPGNNKTPLAVGVISVSRRNLLGPFPTRVVPRPRLPAAVPQITGVEVDGRGYLVLSADGKAAKAGIRPSDEIVSIGTEAIHNRQDIVNCVKKYRAGQCVDLHVLRKDRAVTLELEMWAKGESNSSFRKDNFPTIFEHDAPLSPDECGGPLIGLDGRGLGITIARVGKYGCLAIPGDCVERLIDELKPKNSM